MYNLLETTVQPINNTKTKYKGQNARTIIKREHVAYALFEKGLQLCAYVFLHARKKRKVVAVVSLADAHLSEK